MVGARKWIARNDLAAASDDGVSGITGSGAGNMGEAVLAMLPGGATTAQIADPAGLTLTRGSGFAHTRASAGFCRKSATFDAANLMQNPENFGAASWQKIASGSVPVVTQNDSAVLAPDGTQSAAQVVYSAVTSGNYGLLRSTAPAASAGSYTYSVWVYSQTSTTIYVSADSTTYTGTVVPANTWTRCSDTRVRSSDPMTADIGFNNPATPTTTGQTIWVWGAKYEFASSPTAYVSPMLVSLGNAVPRVEPEGLLMEFGATNLLKQSQDFNNIAWDGPTGQAVDVAIAPDGTMTADQCTFNGSFNLQVYQNHAVTASTTYTFSVWARTASGTASFKLSRTNTASWVTATVSGVLTATTQWQRFTLTYTSGAGETASAIVIGGEGKTPYTPPAGTIYIWGAQAEVGSRATSYIPTTTTTAARSTDGVTYGAGVPITTQNGSIYMKLTPAFTGSSLSGGNFCVGSGAGNFLYMNNDTNMYFFDGSLAQVNAGYVSGVTKAYSAVWNPAGRTLSNITDAASGSGPALGNTFTNTTLIGSLPGIGSDFWITDLRVYRR